MGVHISLRIPSAMLRDTTKKKIYPTYRIGIINHLFHFNVFIFFDSGIVMAATNEVMIVIFNAKMCGMKS